MQKCNMKPSAKCRVKRWLAVCCRAVIAMKWIHEYSSGRCEEMSKMSCGFCTRRVTSQRVRMGGGGGFALFWTAIAERCAGDVYTVRRLDLVTFLFF